MANSFDLGSFLKPWPATTFLVMGLWFQPLFAQGSDPASGSEPMRTQRNPSGTPRPRTSVTIPATPAADVPFSTRSSGYSEIRLGEELLDIVNTIRRGDRASLVDLSSKIDSDIENRRNEGQESMPDPETLLRSRTQRDLLDRSVIGRSGEILSEIQKALVETNQKSATALKEFVNGDAGESLEVVRKMPGSIYDIRIDYVRENDGAEAVVKRNVTLVPKAVSSLEESENSSLRDLATDPALKPIMKGDLIAQTVSEISDPVERLLAESPESTQKVSEIKNGAPKVETEETLKTKADALEASIAQVDENLKNEVDRASKQADIARRKRDIASETRDQGTEKLEAQRAFAEWAITNPEDAKKLDECGRAGKAIELSGISPERFEARIQDKCPQLKGSYTANLEKGVLGISPNASNQGSAPGGNFSQQQLEQTRIQSLLSVVASCMNMNTNASEAITRVRDQFKATYDAISGFGNLEKILRSSRIMHNVLAKMDERGYDPRRAARDVADEVDTLYPDGGDGKGNKALHSEMLSLFDLKADLTAFIEEYKKRSEKMARSLAEVAAQNFIATYGNSINQQDPAAVMAFRQQAERVFEAERVAQFDRRMQEPDHVQLTTYRDAVSAAASEVSSLYGARVARATNLDQRIIGVTESNAVIQGRQVLNASPQLRSAPDVLVENASQGRLPASNVPAAQSGGAFRSNAGAALPTSMQPTTRQVPASGTRTNSSHGRTPNPIR